MARPLFLLLLVAPLASAAVPAAPTYQPVDTIRQSAMVAVAGAGAPGVEVEAVVDPALRLPACEQPLAAQPATAGTVEVACTGQAGWRLYVPVKLRRYQEVVVVQRPLMAGASLDGDALALERREVGRLNGVLVDPAAVQGYSLRRPVAAGAVLTAADVQSPRLVRRGDSVTLVARAGGIEVRALGKAMADAGLGERVGVENLASRRLLQGVVRGGGEVEIGR